MQQTQLNVPQEENVNKQILTEVTSIAKEEKRTGTAIPLPSAEELVVRASASLLNLKKAANTLLPTMSKKDIMRVFNAILELPQEGLPVYLKSEEAKKLFSIGQRAIMDRYVVITHHVHQEIKKAKLEKQNETNTQEKQNV